MQRGGGLRTLPVDQRQEPLALVLPRALLLAHPFQFFTDFGRVLVLPLKGNKQRFLFGKLPFTSDYFALDASQLVIDSFVVNAA